VLEYIAMVFNCVVFIYAPDCAFGAREGRYVLSLQTALWLCICVTPQTALWEPGENPGVRMDTQTALWVCLETF
jgi:hypothetical protein